MTLSLGIHCWLAEGTRCLQKGDMLMGFSITQPLSEGNTFTLLPTKRDGHRNVGDQFHLLLALLGVLSWSRLVAPLRPSNFFYLMVYGDFLDFHVVPPVKSGWKKLKGPRGPTCINQHRTPRSTRKRWNWSPTFQCPSLFVRGSVGPDQFLSFVAHGQ